MKTHQLLIWIAINLIITVYLFFNYTFKDVLFFWLLSGISFHLWSIAQFLNGWFRLFQFLVKMLLIEKSPNEIKKLAERVYDSDANSIPYDDFNKRYESIASTVNAKIWYTKMGGISCVDRASARNIVSQFMGYSVDEEVTKKITHETQK